MIDFADIMHKHCDYTITVSYEMYGKRKVDYEIVKPNGQVVGKGYIASDKLNGNFASDVVIKVINAIEKKYKLKLEVGSYSYSMSDAIITNLIILANKVYTDAL